ncbi:MAG TPA: TRAP transporter substrate-binding protein DctP [Vicinamibacteria bacterium]|nr:TRAP transporter substrate-binding protein DctP [Vicinamibacteria bacterium]
MNRRILHLCLFLFLLSAVGTEAAVVVRLGTLAPTGSSWELILKRMGVEWSKATGDELRLRIYAGGTVGDESEMIRKMRIGQLQAAAISNAGLAEIDAGAYALMLPMMFASYEEWDHVRQKVNPLLEEKLKEKGFVVLAWSDVGWVYFFTKKPMKTPSDLRGMKLAGSHTESRTIDIFKWAGFNPVPISTVDMMTGLQTGLIDSLYLPIILAEGSQYYRQAPHMTDMKWAPLQGAVVMHEKGWVALTDAQKAEVLRITQKVGEELRASNRAQEERSLEAMKSRGLSIVPVEDAIVEEWAQTVEKAYPRVRESLVPPSIFDEVVRLRDEYRKTRTGAPR